MPAIDAPRSNLFWLNDDQVVVVTDPSHPLYDERVTWPLNEAMVISIMRKGVIKPIRIRKSADNLLEVVDGRRRVMHLREANRRLKLAGEPPKQVKAELMKGDDAEAYSICAAANLHEPETPLSRARKAVKMMNQGRSEADVAADIGCTEAHLVNNLLPLVDMSPVVQKAVEQRKMTASAAIQLKNKSADEQKAIVAALLDNPDADDADETEGQPETPTGAPVEAPSVAKPAKPKRVTARRVAAAQGKDVAPRKRDMKAVAAKMVDSNDPEARAIGMAIFYIYGDASLESTGQAACFRKAVKSLGDEKAEKEQKKAERKAKKATKQPKAAKPAKAKRPRKAANA